MTGLPRTDNLKVFVTGGCGFIGSNFIRYLLDTHPSYKVCNLDKLTYAGNPANLADLHGHPRYTFVKGDICDRRIVFDIARQSDVLVNFAAETHVDNSITSADAFVRTNVFGTQVLLDAAAKSKIRRVLHISTDEVYGSIKKGAFKETDTFLPNSPYAASKAGAEHLARAHFQTFKTPVLITRSSNNFGPYQYPEKVIPLFVTNLLEGKKVPLYGSGLNVRDWIFVEDNCAGIDFVLHQGTVGEAYNIGGGHELTNLELTKRILAHCQKDDTSIAYVADRPGHDWRYALDCAKMHRLGWKPRHSFDTALKKTVQWYTENPQWWKPLKPS